MTECSVLSGEVQRTWQYRGKDGKQHTIDLFHDTLTGTRSLAIDLGEVEGSLGTTPFYSRQATTIPFSIGDERGVVLIEKVGLLSFRYSCLVGGVKLRATLQDVAGDEEQYAVSVVGTASTLEPSSSSSEASSVTWYEVSVERRSDGARTAVHRRYREFCQLYDQVEAGLKGHHLLSSLPSIPGKQLKLLVDHTDPSFIEERRLQLDGFLGKLLGVPHVCSMVPVQIFLGLYEQIKEHSVVFREQDPGLSLELVTSQGEQNMVVAARAEGSEASRSRIQVSDSISKVNGEVVSEFGLAAVREALSSRGPRPLVVHFLQPVSRNPQHLLPLTSSPDSTTTLHEQQRSSSGGGRKAAGARPGSTGQAAAAARGGGRLHAPSSSGMGMGSGGPSGVGPQEGDGDMGDDDAQAL